MKINVDNLCDENCYGCTACYNICPKKAISMVENEEGFLYPVVDKDKCINCGLCRKVCPYINKKGSRAVNNILIAQSKDNDNLDNCSSGGVFFELAKNIINKNGYVCGCIMDNKFNVQHILTNNLDDLKKMRGSKYVQSNLNDVFFQIKDKLKNNIIVLFIGTPCQVHGLKTYLGRDYANLFTVDLLCHGVPSQKVFNSYINYIKDKNGKIDSFKFRDKRVNGWKEMGSIQIKKGGKNTIIKTSFNNDSYYYYFLNSYINRMTCYNCKYKSSKRYSDITLGDAWSFKYNSVLKNVNKGLSLVFINSTIGADLLSQIKNDLYLENVNNIDTLTRRLDNHSNYIPTIRKKIINDIFNYGYSKIEKETCNYKYFKPFIKSLIPFSVKKRINNMLSRSDKNEN